MSTEVEIQTGSERPLYTLFVRDGIPGNYDVVYQMIKIIRNSCDYDKSIEALAKQLLIDNGLDSYAAEKDQFEIVFNFVKSHVIYIQDIAGAIESLKSARQTISDGWGDCDDHAVCNATLLGCLGFESVKIAMARYGANDKTFGHVYCVAYSSDGARYVFDTSLPDAKLNDEVKPYEVHEINVFGTVNGLDGWSGLFNNLRTAFRTNLKTATTLLPQAANVLPLGFVAGQAFSAGANLLNSATSTNPDALSLSNTASKINRSLDDLIVQLNQQTIAYDLAKSYALQAAAQLMAVETTSKDKYTYEIVMASIKDKLNYIKNFPDFAEKNGMKCVRLNSGMMLAAGAALTGAVGYGLYKEYKRTRGVGRELERV